MTELARNPASQRGKELLVERAFDARESDPALADQAAAAIAAYHRRRAEAGDVQALVDLGDFLYCDEPEAARAAYQEARRSALGRQQLVAPPGPRAGGARHVCDQQSPGGPLRRRGSCRTALLAPDVLGGGRTSCRLRCCFRPR